MAVVTLRVPLRDLAGGRGKLSVGGSSVGEMLRTLESEHPKLTGWILNEQGRIRPHVSVFVNGERTGEDSALGPEDEVQVLPSISGGCG